VRGKLGSRHSDREGDKDYYRVPLEGRPGAPVKLAITVGPIRNMDLALYVLDRSGKRLAVVDNAGVGAGETLPSVGVGDDVAYVVVQESRDGAGHGPTENVTDEYELTVRQAPFGGDEEREPNEADNDATSVSEGAPARGTLARWRDVDKWRFTGAAGTYAIEVSGGESLPRVAIRVGAGTAEPGRRREASLAPGTVISVERADPEAPPEQRKPLDGTTMEYKLSITRAK
jgi:hypothetical protein